MRHVAICVLLLGFCPLGRSAPEENSIGMKLTVIPAGDFTMGTGTAPPRSRDEWLTRDYDESPAHQVRISREFRIGIHEVTNKQYELFDPKHRSLRGKDGTGKSDDDPVTHVTWLQAVAFCEWLTKNEKRPYRLPTEAEWEYACRSGGKGLFHTGDLLTPDSANIGIGKDGKPHDSTMPVGSFKPNAWGVHDMHGNVQEWCLDYHGPYSAGTQTDPVGPVGGYARVCRGWSYGRVDKVPGSLRLWRSANRSGQIAADSNKWTGFRVVQAAMPETKPTQTATALYQQGVKGGAAPKGGPDPAQPFHVNFNVPGKAPTIAKDAFGPVFAQHNHYGAVCVCPNGDVLWAWYTTVSESGRELAQAITRLRVGSDQWEPASLFFDVPDMNDHAPVLFCDGKRIYHWCTQSLKGWDHASNIQRYSDDNGVTWSEPTVILSRDDPKALSQPCSAYQTADGTIILACDGDLHRDERLMIGTDKGKFWKVGAGCMRVTAGKYAIHPAVAPAEDGRVINFLRGPDPMPMQLSKDRGDTWTQVDSPFPGIRSGQKATALKLRSKALMLVSIDNKGTIVEKGGTFAALSHDDGATWSHVRRLEGVGGYMSSAQAANGVIYVTGSRMGAVAFNETWLKEGKPVPRK